MASNQSSPGSNNGNGSCNGSASGGGRERKKRWSPKVKTGCITCRFVSPLSQRRMHKQARSAKHLCFLWLYMQAATSRQRLTSSSQSPTYQVRRSEAKLQTMHLNCPKMRRLRNSYQVGIGHSANVAQGRGNGHSATSTHTCHRPNSN